MHVSIGQEPPDFTLYSSDRKPWKPSDFRGRPIVLLFFPAAFSGVCTEQLCTLNDDLAAYQELAAEVVGISTDSPYVLREYKKAHDLRMTFLSDHSADVALAFGAKYDHDFEEMKLDRVARRAAFVLDAEGIVRYAQILQDADDRIDLEAVKQAVQVSCTSQPSATTPATR